MQGGAGSGAPSPLMPPPPVMAGGGYHSRSSSMDQSSRPGTSGTPTSYGSRPQTPTLVLPSAQTPSSPSGAVTKEKKKSSWFGKGKRDKNEAPLPAAWIAGHPQRLAYDADSLVNGRPMQEMWDDVEGNCYVYIFPRNSGKGASFKIDSAVFASSPVLTKLAFGDLYSNAAVQNSGDRRQQLPLDARAQGLSLNDPSTPPMTPKQHTATMTSMSSTSTNDSRGHFSNLSDPAEAANLYIPVKLNTDGSSIPTTITQSPSRSRDSAQKDPAMEDLQTLIDIRNFFAFLCGQSLVATEKKHSFFHIFMTISGILKTYEFSNLDGSTYGEAASASFDSYVDELGFQDVRTSREKTMEGIVLGERMKSTMLYNEAFTHAAGKYEDLVGMKSVKFGLISSVTENRLIRASMDLEKRTASIRLILNDFEFPALFTGIMASKTSEERKEGVRFEAWKEAFLGFRRNVLAMYKAKYGAWPPKASSKKNDLETSGLNRLVLKDVYHDMSSLYDLIVNKTNLTTRTVDGADHSGPREEPTTRALRAVLSEYDRSSPPVKPPVPFDLPRLPSLKSTRPDFGQDKRKDIKALQKKLKDDEIAPLLRASWNNDQDVPKTPFTDAFKEMEKRAAHGCTVAEIVDQRIGQWIFMYVVLQALPMLAVDAPGLRHTKGVEYFLCEPPRSGVPWANPNAAHAAAGGQGGAGSGRTWFSVGEGGGVVSLPADVVEHGVEGIYRRSHCWVVAERWTRANPVMNAALAEQEAMNKRSLDAQEQRPVSRHGGDPGGTRGGYTFEDLPPPPPAGNALLSPDGSSSSPNRASKRYSSLGIGLEALPLPMGVTPDGSAPAGYTGYTSPPTLGTPLGTPGAAGGYGGGGAGGYFGGAGAGGSRPGTPSNAAAVGGGGAGGPGGARHVQQHSVDSSKTFDAILGGMGEAKGKKGRK